MIPITRDEFAQLVINTKARSRLERELRFVPEQISNWENRDFLAVTTKGGGEGVLVVSLENIHVLPFQLQKRKPNSAGRIEAVICDICSTGSAVRVRPSLCSLKKSRACPTCAVCMFAM